MICKICNNNIPDGSLVCPHCGHAEQLIAEREKLDALRNEERLALVCEKEKRIFLFFVIFLSVGALMSLFPLVRGDITCLLPAVFMIISLVGWWKCFAAKDNIQMADGLRKASCFDAYNKVIFTALSVICGVLTLGLVALLATAKSAFDSNPEMAGLIDVLIVIFVILGVISLAVMLVLRYFYSKRQMALRALAKHDETGIYEGKQLSIVGSCIIGGISLLGGIVSLGTYGVSSLLLDFFNGFLNGFFTELPIEGGGTISSLVMTAMSAYLSSLTADAVAKICMGLYYILSAIWVSGGHDGIAAARSKIDRQNVIRLDLERRVKEEQARINRARVNSTSKSEPANTDDTEFAAAETPAAEEAPTSETSAADEAPTSETSATETITV